MVYIILLVAKCKFNVLSTINKSQMAYDMEHVLRFIIQFSSLVPIEVIIVPPNAD